MSSIIKVQNIQYTDGDAALTIADGGGVTAAATLGVTGESTLTGGAKVNTIKDTTGTTGITVNSAGFISRPETPCMSASKNISSQNQVISGSNMYVVGSLNSSYGNSHSVNNKSYFDSSTSRFTIPSGQPTGFYFCSFQTILGIARPSSGVNWGYIAIRKGSGSNNHITEGYREVTNAMGTSSYVWETLNCSCVVSLAAGDYIEPIFSGSAGVEIRVHSGTYTNFSVAQIG